ncbi:hypothetical protein CUMW_133790 [Citrus unshiu]|nr:hypothetical protein CUMW_133790 [Citrus unshiu]
MGCVLVHEHAGRFGSVAERERSTALGNSLKEVEELLVYFQQMRSWQLTDRRAAFHFVCKTPDYVSWNN